MTLAMALFRLLRLSLGLRSPPNRPRPPSLFPCGSVGFLAARGFAHPNSVSEHLLG